MISSLLPGRLDSYLFRRAALATLMVAALMIIIAVSIDFLVNIGTLAKSTDKSGRFLLVLELYWWRLPQLANIALPTATVIAALLVCAPMLRRGEFVALSASGISPARAARVLPLVAILMGGIDAVIADSLTPGATVETTRIEDTLENQRRLGRVWQVPATGTSWFAARAQGLIIDKPPSVDRVVIAYGSGLIMADKLIWQGKAWELQGHLLEFRIEPDGRAALYHPTEIPLEADLALPYDPQQLYAKLLPRDTMSSRQLLRLGDRSDTAYAWSRWARGLYPLLAVLVALPAFVRFVHRDNLISGVAKALGAAALPIVGMVVGGYAAETSGLPPLAVVIAAACLALVPSLIAFWRWRL
jgi:lipopolysaccharide export LptBFGC system permease protein LptF